MYLSISLSYEPVVPVPAGAAAAGCTAHTDPAKR